MSDGQTLGQAASNINFTQVAVAAAASAVGAGAIGVGIDLIKAGPVFKIPFDALTRSQRNLIGDLLGRVLAAGVFVQAKGPIGRAYPWIPFGDPPAEVCPVRK